MTHSGETDEKRVKELKAQLNDKLDVYDKILSKQPYLAGQVNTRLFFVKFYIINIVFFL
jgi:glutathione S-transferase